MKTKLERVAHKVMYIGSNKEYVLKHITLFGSVPGSDISTESHFIMKNSKYGKPMKLDYVNLNFTSYFIIEENKTETDRKKSLSITPQNQMSFIRLLKMIEDILTNDDRYIYDNDILKVNPTKQQSELAFRTRVDSYNVRIDVAISIRNSERFQGVNLTFNNRGDLILYNMSLDEVLSLQLQLTQINLYQAGMNSMIYMKDDIEKSIKDNTKEEPKNYPKSPTVEELDDETKNTFLDRKNVKSQNEEVFNNIIK